MGCIRTAVFGSIAALLAAVSAAPPAAADRYEEGDPAADMVAVTGTVVSAPTHREMDIRRVVVRHTDRVVSVRVWVRQLTRPSEGYGFAVGGYVKVDRSAGPEEGVGWMWYAAFDPRHPGELRVEVVESAYGDDFTCTTIQDSDGLKARANYYRDRITVIIPRHCLSDRPEVQPQWVRASVFTRHTLPDDPSQPHYSDSAWGPYPTHVSTSRFTPRLYPG